MLRNLKLGARLSLLIGCLVLAGFVVSGLITTRMSAGMATEMAQKSTSEMAQHYAAVAETELDDAATAARTLAQSLEAMKTSGDASRTAGNAIMRNVLESNPNACSVWSCWEPNAFDGKDRQYVNSSCSDASGRYITYVQRTSSGIKMTNLPSYSQPGEDDFYLLARNSGKETITPPYKDDIDGKSVLMTSLAVPIRMNGQVVGVAGIDMPLDHLNKLVAQIKPSGTGYAAMVSSDNKYAAHPGAEWIGQDIGNDDTAAAIKEAISSKKLNVAQTDSKFMKGTRVLRVTVPMVLGRTSTPWALMVNAPMNKVLAAAGRIRNTVILTTLLTLLLTVGVLMKLISSAIVQRVQRVANGAKSLAKGDTSFSVKATRNDEIGDLANSVNSVAESLRALVGDTNSLTQAAAEGRLDVRADEGSHEGDYRTLIHGVNATLDAVVQPLNMAAEYVERISHGDIPPLITESYNGDFNEIKNNLNRCITSIKALVEDTNELAEAAVEGRLDVRADASRLEGDFAQVIQGLNATLDAVTGPLNVAAEYIERISNGDIPEKVVENYNGDFNEIKNNLNKLIDAVNALVADAQNLAQGVIAGDLERRGDPGKLAGSYAELISNMNKLMEAVDVPVTEITKALQRLAVNDTKTDVSTDRPGVWKKLAEEANTVNRRIGHVVEISVALSKGDTHELPQLQALGKRSENDELVPAMTQMMEAIQALVTDAEKLSQAAVEGRLDARADASKHLGQYRDVILGVNNTLDAVTGPLNVAAEYVERISNGDIPDTITDDYNGDFNEIKNNLNKCIDAVRALVTDAESLADAAVHGDLSTRADDSKHRGDFARIIQGVNHTLDAITTPLNETATVLHKLASNDLTARMQGEYQGDYNQIKDSLNNALDSLEAAITQVAGTAHRVASSSEELAQTAQETGTATQQIAESSERVAKGSTEQSAQAAETNTEIEQLARAVDDLAKGAQEQARVVESAVSAVNEITQGIAEVAQNAESAATNTADVAKVAQTGQLAVQQSVEGMGRIKETTDAAAQSIAQLGEASKQIGAIVEASDDLAEQTNLLALNAAIEAARAGEHGKGFAVVADEVRKLAERSSKETKEIADRITRIQNITQEAVDAMEAGSREVENGSERAVEAGRALESIMAAVNGVVQQVQVVTSAAQTIDASSAEVVQAIESVSALTEETAASVESMAASNKKVLTNSQQVAAISEENAAAAEEMSAATEEQNASIEELSASTDELSRSAVQLQELVAQFRISNVEASSDTNAIDLTTATKSRGRRKAA